MARSLCPELAGEGSWEDAEELVFDACRRQMDVQRAELRVLWIVEELTAQGDHQTLVAEAGGEGRESPVDHAAQELQGLFLER